MAAYLPFDQANLMELYKKIATADFSCPPWFSASAKKLIKRILDLNPLTRTTIQEILQDEWFKKGYKPPHFKPDDDVNLDDVDAIFNDSKGLVKRETRFASKCSANEIMSKIEEAAKPLGFNVNKGNFKVHRRKILNGQTTTTIRGDALISHIAAGEGLDIEILKRERMRRAVSLADQIQEAKNKRAELTRMEVFSASSSTQPYDNHK